nr:MAG TPA: hypothetical protein [Microviridae sp.]
MKLQHLLRHLLQPQLETIRNPLGFIRLGTASAVPLLYHPKGQNRVARVCLAVYT